MKKVLSLCIMSILFGEIDSTNVKYNPNTGKKSFPSDTNIKFDPMTGEPIKSDSSQVKYNHNINMVDQNLTANKNKDPKWYRLFGMGPSLTNNLENAEEFYIKNNTDANIGLNIGFYNKYNSKSLIGFCLSGKRQEKTFYTNFKSEIDYYLYALSYISFINEFNKGAYFKIDFGYAVSSYQYDNKNIDIEKTGLGWMVGIGRVLKFNNFSILTGIDYSILNLKTTSENIFNTKISFLLN